MLLEVVKQTLRVTSDAYDDEINMLIDAAIADMLRAGVDKRLLDKDNMYPLAKSGIICYVKANFGYDNQEAGRFKESYVNTLIHILNSPLATSEWFDHEI